MNRHLVAIIAACLVSGCASTGSDLRDAPPPVIEQHLADDAGKSTEDSETVETVEKIETVETDGTFESYVALALENQPSLSRHADLWRASTYEATAAGAWPRLSVSYAFLPFPVETRLGPQRHRIGVRQGIPWPGRTAAAAEAAAAEADVSVARLNATADEIVREVGLAYWDLWEARQRGVILSDQLSVLETSARIARGGIEVGAQGLSSVTRIELAASRLRDAQAANSARIAAAEQRLRGALAIDAKLLPTRPAPFQSAQLDDEVTDVTNAPTIDIMRKQVDAASRKAEAAELSARPSFSVGVDWILVGRGSAMADDAGRDALMVMLGISLPTTWNAEGARADAAKSRSDAAAHGVDAGLIDRRARARAELEVARDASRRTTFYGSTLLPQAETAFEAALGDYEAGRATVADILLAQRDWLDLAIGEIAARASYERAIVRLNTLTGQTPRPSVDGGKNE